MLNQIKVWGIQQVPWAEKNLIGKTGAGKKAAVIQKLDELIVLPSYLEWVDNLILSWLVDKVCEKLNAVTRHNFGGLVLTEKEEQAIAEEIPNKADTNGGEDIHDKNNHD